MKKVVAFNGSVRKNGNTTQLLSSFLNGTEENKASTESFYAHELNLDFCTGCLRCNLIRRCSIRNDDWDSLSKKIVESDIIVFASPIYFHHVSSQLKKVIDRFRSFVHVQITETGLEHIPHFKWEKDFVLLLSLGSSNNEDARPVIELFQFMINILGPENRLHTIIATRLGVINQIIKSEKDLEILYPKLGLPVELALTDYQKNSKNLDDCYKLGKELTT